MPLLTGRRVLVTGLLSNRSIAYGVAKAARREGAELAFTYQNERFRERVEDMAREFGSDIALPCDVAEDAQRLVEIRILRGLEADILSDGQLDVPAELLAQLDVLIASIHARHRLDRRQMTERLVRALSLPVFKIWGHPLGRILRHREPIDCDLPAVLDALAASRGAIEINGDPHRLDLPPEWLPAARARNIPFVVSVDAHSVRGFGVARHGVLMARRAGTREARRPAARASRLFSNSFTIVGAVELLSSTVTPRPARATATCCSRSWSASPNPSAV